MKQIRIILNRNPRIKYIVWLGFLVQLITSITALGFFHPDQHFQIIEFSSHQLKLSNATSYVWELQTGIRSSIQVYLFSGFVTVCKWIGVANAFTQLTILRIITGSLYWLMINLIGFWYFKRYDSKVLFWVLAAINFSWFLPYSRTLFSSETMGAVLFFAALFLYQRREHHNTFNTKSLIWIGFLFCLSFFFRFQMAFALVGFGLYVLLVKQYKNILPIVAGFVLGLILNVLLDYGFYGKVLFTPYLYFKWNIVEGKAASFGEENFAYYIAVLLALITIAPLSIILFLQYLKISFVKFRNPLILSVLLFIIGHCVVSHKEERFLFPITDMMPVVLGYAVPALVAVYYSKKAILKYSFRSIFWLSITLNMLLLVLFMFIPYAQTLSFANKLNGKLYKTPPAITCIERTPLETESLAPYIFYQSSFKNVSFKKVSTIDSLKQTPVQPKFLAATYNHVKENFKWIDSCGYTPVEYSSSLLWNLNKYLQSKNLNTVNDIWVLYQKK